MSNASLDMLIARRILTFVFCPSAVRVIPRVLAPKLLGDGIDESRRAGICRVRKRLKSQLAGFGGKHPLPCGEGRK
jgi:hypothetical protein